MKNQLSNSTKIGLTVLLGVLGSAQGIERPGGAPTVVPRAEIVPENNQVDQKSAAKKPLEVKRAFLGVTGDPVSEDLAWHLNLESGLQLVYVLEGSPADLAGLTKRDVVISIDGKKLASQLDLRTAVQAKAPGEEITLKLIRRGRLIEQKIKLVERVAMPQPPGAQDPFPADVNPLIDPRGAGSGRIPNLDIQRQLLEEVEKEMEKALGMKKGEDIQEFDIGDLFDQNVGVKAASSVMFQDKEGSVEMRTTDGAREIVIRDIDGKIVFEGPYNSDVDKAAVPEAYQERVEKIGLDKDGGGRMFKFKLNHENK